MRDVLEIAAKVWPFVLGIASVIAMWVTMRRDVAEALRLARESKLEAAQAVKAAAQVAQESKADLASQALKVVALETSVKAILDNVNFIRNNMLLRADRQNVK